MLAGARSTTKASSTRTSITVDRAEEAEEVEEMEEMEGGTRADLCGETAESMKASPSNR